MVEHFTRNEVVAGSIPADSSIYFFRRFKDMGIGIIATGRKQPDFVLDNAMLSDMVETNNEWIVERTGINTRRVATSESSLDLACEAALDAMGYDEETGTYKIDKDSIDLIVFATVTPDDIVPCMSSQLKKRLGMKNAAAFDINAACSGFVYGTWIGESIMKSGMFPGGSETNKIKRALIIGSERLTRITNWEDRTTCILFGDGSGTAILEDNPAKTGIIASCIKNYDDEHGALKCGMDYYETPFGKEPDKKRKVTMAGQQVFRFAVKAVTEVMDEVLERAGLTPDDIKYYVPHQANMRIIQFAAQRFKQPIEKFHVCIDHMGNTSTASVPMALDELMKSGKVNSGDKIMLVAFGGGLSAGAIIFEAN